MAVIAAISGNNLIVGEETSPDFTVAMTGDGGVITQNTRRTVVAVGGSTTALEMGGISKASTVWIRCRDSSGDPKKAKILLNGSVTIPEITEMTLFSKTPDTGFTAVSVINDIGSSASLTIDYAIAG